MNAESLLSNTIMRFGASERDNRFIQMFWRSLADAQFDFCSKRRWGFLLEADATVDTTASTRSVSLASNFNLLFRDDCVRDATNSSWLERITYTSWRDRWYEDGTSTGTPGKFWIIDKTMYFTPVPTSAYTISYAYYKRPTTPSQNSTDITVPDEYREVLEIMVHKRLIVAGFRPVLEIEIDGAEISRLIANAAMDDLRRYREMRMSLPRTSRKMRHG